MKKLLFLVVALVLTTSLSAQVNEKKQVPQGEPSAALSDLGLAADLVKYGYAQQSALPLIQALQIIKDNPTQPLTAQREGETVDRSQAKSKYSVVTLEYDKILADAKAFAKGNDTMLKLIAQIEAEGKGAVRGAVGGPKKHYDTVNGNSTDTYEISFYGDELAEVYVSGDGDTDLDLYVYDSRGNLIDKDDDYTDECYVRWVPAWTGKFIIRIVNRGSVYNEYLLMTN